MSEPYYEQDGITIYHGDNVSVMSELESESIDLVVTSPPYDKLRDYGGHSWDFEGVAQQLWRVIKPGGVVVWIVADATVEGSETGTSFRQALRFMEIGFRLHDTMIWRSTGVGAKGSNEAYWQSWEFMFVMSNGKPLSINRLRDLKNQNIGHTQSPTVHAQSRHGGYRTTEELGIRQNVWDYDTVCLRWDDGGDHPAKFPEALARDHILSWSNEGDTVLDPFNGSGTTTKMAKHMGRNGIGIDVHERYCEIAANRLRQGVLPFT